MRWHCLQVLKLLLKFLKTPCTVSLYYKYL